jgi:ribose 5-phosphate isomerase B
MPVYLGTDHAGYDLKAHLARELAAQGYEIVDVGPASFDPKTITRRIA